MAAFKTAFLICLVCISYQAAARVKSDSVTTLAPDAAPRTASRVLLVGYRSSGSSFAANLIQQTVASSFYFYEPFRGSVGLDYRYDYSQSMAAMGALDSVFNCADEVFSPGFWANNSLANLMGENAHYGALCAANSGVCDARLDSSRQPAMASPAAIAMQRACLASSLKVAKTVRLPMEFIDTYIDGQDETTRSTLHVIFLVRDPRAVMNSRRHRWWGARTAECLSYVDLCAHMRVDMNAFEELKMKYPGNVWLLKFEDLARDPFTEARVLFKQLGIGLDEPRLKFFLETHTKGDFNGLAGQLERDTVRDSKQVADKWKTEMPEDDALEIRRFCSDVIHALEA